MMAEEEPCKMCNEPALKNNCLCEKCASEQYTNVLIEEHERRLKALEEKV